MATASRSDFGPTRHHAHTNVRSDSMKRLRLLIGSSLLLALAAVGHADDSGSFVVRLGQDTTSVERYQRTASRLEVFQVGRAPRVLRRHLVYDLDKGNV